MSDYSTLNQWIDWHTKKLLREAVGYLVLEGHKVNYEAVVEGYFKSPDHWRIRCSHDMKTGALKPLIEWDPVPPEEFYSDPDNLHAVTVGVV